MNLGNKIQNLRKDKNITQEDLASELGVTAAAVSKWENDYTLPDVIMLCAIADYFNVTTDELLGRAKETTYAIISAETLSIGKKVEKIAKQYGVKTLDIYTDYKQAQAAASQNEAVQHLIACYFGGFYEACPGKSTLISVAPTEDEVLTSIRLVFDQFLKS